MAQIRICPKCKSTSIRRETMDTFGQTKILPSYVCNNCHYSGTLFPEITLNNKKVNQ